MLKIAYKDEWYSIRKAKRLAKDMYYIEKHSDTPEMAQIRVLGGFRVKDHGRVIKWLRKEDARHDVTRQS